MFLDFFYKKVYYTKTKKHGGLMKRTSQELRINLKKEKKERAKKAQEYKSERRDNTRIGRCFITVDYYSGSRIEDTHTAVKCRRFFRRLNKKRERRESLLETKNQLLDKIFVEEEEKLRIEKFEEYDDENDKISFKSIINFEKKRELEEAMA